jgi:hypothetical protein
MPPAKEEQKSNGNGSTADKSADGKVIDPNSEEARSAAAAAKKKAEKEKEEREEMSEEDRKLKEVRPLYISIHMDSYATTT